MKEADLPSELSIAVNMLISQQLALFSVVSPEFKPEVFTVDLCHKCHIFCQKETKKTPKDDWMPSVALLCSWSCVTVTWVDCRVAYHYSFPS